MKWFIVVSQGPYILGVFGSACRDMAEECAARVEDQTGFEAHVLTVEGERPCVGQIAPAV